MKQAKRKKNSKAENDVLEKSKRRCCLCFGWDEDSRRKKGQIAHLDKNPANDKPDNLAFLCLNHHDEYDSITSQSKSIQKTEVKNTATNSIGTLRAVNRLTAKFAKSLRRKMDMMKYSPI
jgi:hypothetical protein